ncbi:MAG: MarR family transcriptional regulator [Gemmatimonadaceae bacterium]
MSARDRDWFVARMGQSTEQDGFPKIAGQLFGLLLWSEEPCSIQQMADALGVSKASVSTDARRLLEHGVLERVPRDGDRRDYYQIAPDFFRRLLQHRLERWENAHDSVIEAREKLKPSAKVTKRLEYMHAVNEFVLERLRQNLADWDSTATELE